MEVIGSRGASTPMPSPGDLLQDLYVQLPTGHLFQLSHGHLQLNMSKLDSSFL